MTGSLEGKVALVTGAGSGLGRGSAISLAAAGAAVVCNDVAAKGLDETIAAIIGAGGRAVAAIGDVSRSADVKTLVAKAVDSFGGLDIVHANAGVERYESLETMADADIDTLLAVDLKGVLLCFREAIPALRSRGGGALIATSSVQATHSLPGCVVYAAAKARVIAAVRTLALEVGKDNIRVVSVSPGTIDTPMLSRDLADMNVADAEGFLQRVRDANALGRIGTPGEIGDVVVYLAGSSASYITGTDIVVDGGFTAVKRF
ncbi:MAG: SDR family oxidoreductase [Devosia nanyangense]|uniref:SDR family oxidoreductase n=1 Tax=Devosia nanyangense TaxID=1228055 RepID=A0A933L2P1_9HYPH|nr:SDR family oxidoreductase [Devosia nanyangense]